METYGRWNPHLFDQALQEATSLEESQPIPGVYHPAAAHGDPLVPEAQYSTLTREDMGHEVEQGVQRFQPESSIAADPTRAQTEMVNVDNTDSSPPIVTCSHPYLHGSLIKGWPHQCKGSCIKNPRGNYCYIRKITCGAEKCGMSFKNARGFDRHYRTVHIRAAKRAKLDCTFEGCDRVGEFGGFTRRDNLIQHMRSVHHEAIPKNRFRFNGPYKRPENVVGEAAEEVGQHGGLSTIRGCL